MMKRALNLALWLLVLSLSAFAQGGQSTDKAAITQHAAEVVARIHDEMLDPGSFVLDRVFITKPKEIKTRKHGGWSKGDVIGTYTSICFEYRSHNTMGGYAEGRAVEDGADNNRLSTYTHDENGHFPGYDVGWGARCGAKNIDREITTDVAAIAPGLYRKSK